jgi:hypothetical protein
MAFFTSRYFGQRNYAKIYGTMFGIFAFGVGIGPALSGIRFDLFRSDIAIILWRRMLERELRAIDEGRPLKQWIPAPAEVVPTLGF